MWDASLVGQTVVAVLVLVVAMLGGLFPSRYEPDSPFFANQRWRYRDLIIVFAVLTAARFRPTRLFAGTDMHRFAVGYGAEGLLIVAAVWTVVRCRQPSPWRALGFGSSTALYDVLWSLRIGLGIVSVFTGLIVLSLLAAGAPLTPLSGRGHLIWKGQVADYAAAFGVTTVLMPIAEELFFRGIAYGPLLRKFGTAGAAVASAALWAAVHYGGLSYGSIFKVVFVFVLGVVYAEIYRRRESLVPTVTFHILGNTTGMFRDGYLGTHLPVFGVSLMLWIVAALWFRAVSVPSEQTVA